MTDPYPPYYSARHVPVVAKTADQYVTGLGEEPFSPVTLAWRILEALDAAKLLQDQPFCLRCCQEIDTPRSA